jgi:hypothetical protein
MKFRIIRLNVNSPSPEIVVTIKEPEIVPDFEFFRKLSHHEWRSRVENGGNLDGNGF